MKLLKAQTDSAAAGAASRDVNVQPAATVQVGSPPAAAEQVPAIKTQQPAAAAPSPDEEVHEAVPHALVPAAGLQLDSAAQTALAGSAAVAQAALAGSAAVAQQLGSTLAPGADPVEEGPSDSNPDRPMAEPVEEDSTASIPNSPFEVSLVTAVMCRHLCTAGPPDSRKGAHTCTAGTL